MTGIMPQPWKHPKTGTYYRRKVVPPKLRRAVGKTEIRISLETKSAAEAKLRFPDALAQADAMLARAAGGPIHLTQQQVSALCGAWYGRELKAREADPGDVETIDEMLSHLFDVYDDGRGFGRRGGVREAVAAEVNHLLATENLQVDADSHAAIAKRIFWLMVELYRTLKRRTEGDYTPDPKLQSFPEWHGPDVQPKKASVGAVSVSDLFEAWANERKFDARTRDGWRGMIGKRTKHVGHEDAAQITDMDIIAWKDSLVASSLAPKTIKTNLTTIKALFRWAAVNKRIANNPAANVEYRAKVDPGQRKLSYTDDDTRKILLMARQERETHKRWAPWLCAFTGARIDEICGAMVADVGVDETGVDFIRIDTVNREAGGRLKNQASIRSVPLHPAIVGEGFLQYVATLPKDGPLFPKLRKNRYGRRGGTGQKAIATWVRKKVGITDKNKAPNHSWRHRFADECRKVGISRELRFAIDGHADAAVGAKYGHEGFPLRVLAEAIAKIKSPV